MLFHRNPWKDPTEGDPNFDNFLRDPTGFLLSKFTGVGRDVAAYLASHVLCAEVEDRVTARDFAVWVKNLPDMIGGRKALHQLKLAKLENRNNHHNNSNDATNTNHNGKDADKLSVSSHNADNGLFVKSPIETKTDRKMSSSALTSSAPMLSSLPAPVMLSLASHGSTLPTPDLEKDAEGEDEMKSATTVDEQITPADTSAFPSPDTPDRDRDEEEMTARGDGDSRSLSTHKRRKRGVRKGKAAQAAIAAAAGHEPSQSERDEMLSELAAASQSLARDLSKQTRPADFDSNDTLDFPPLGTTPSQAAAAKKSKWKNLIKMSSGNPELAALARRVAERDASSVGNWSAPAQLQHDPNRYVVRPHLKQTQTAATSSGFSSQLSSFGPVSSATSSSGVLEDDEPRVRGSTWEEDAQRGRTSRRGGGVVGAGRGGEDETSRARKAALAAAAITGNMDPMGAFGTNRHQIYNGHPRTTALGHANPPTLNQRSSLHPIEDEDVHHARPGVVHKSIQAGWAPPRPKDIPPAPTTSKDMGARVSVETTWSSRPTLSSMESASTIMPSASSPHGHGPNKPKLKGQIQNLAKMLSGLKTKGRD